MYLNTYGYVMCGIGSGPLVLACGGNRTGLVAGGAVDALVLDTIVREAEVLVRHLAADDRQVAAGLLPNLCEKS